MVLKHRRKVHPANILLPVSGAVLVLFILIPVAAVFFNLTPADVVEKVAQPLVYQSLRLSLLTSMVSVLLIVLLGTPLAFGLARYNFWGRKLVDAVVDLPMVLPPAVAGVALLMAFGRYGLVGRLLGLNVSFSSTAVVIAQVFVAAPFYVRAAKSAFSSVDVNLEKVSQALGVSPWATFWRVTLPLSLPGLIGGTVMSWARALGEFGATIMFAGNLQGVTRTLPLAIYTAMESDFQAAMVIAAMMILFAVAVLGTVKWVLADRRAAS